MYGICAISPLIKPMQAVLFARKWWELPLRLKPPPTDGLLWQSHGVFGEEKPLAIPAFREPTVKLALPTQAYGEACSPNVTKPTWSPFW